MQWQKYKSLNYLCQTSASSRACAVFFHGYGADAQDLASLANAYQLKTEVDWFFPQGVLEVPIGPMMSGRAWFQLRASDFEGGGKPVIQDEAIDPEALRTLDKVATWLNDLQKSYDHVVLGGFSQGSILISHLFYRLHFCPQALVLYSGYLLHPSSFPTLSKEQCPHFYQSHGRQDTVLPVGGARKLFDKLESLGLKGEWHEFNGAHEIPPQVIESSNNFLNTQLGVSAGASS